MNSTHNNLARIISTGFVVSLIFSIVLFWADAVLRKVGKADLVRGKRQILSLKLGDEENSDPNLAVSPAYMHCSTPFEESDIFLDMLLDPLGWITGFPQEPHPWQFPFDLTYAEIPAIWNAGQGLIVIERANSKEAASQIQYVGPKGFSDRPDGAIERFLNPQLCYNEDLATLLLYDMDLKRIFRIDLAREKVTSKSWADKSIVATGRKYLGKFHTLLRLHVRGATRLETDLEMKVRLDKETQEIGMGMDSYMDEASMPFFDPRMASVPEPQKATRKRVLFGPIVERALPTSGPWAMDEQGTIYLIDRDTLSLSPPLGHLPDCGPEKTHDPSRLLSYCVLPLFVDGQFFGLATAALSRDGSESVMVLLDSKGGKIGRTASYSKPQSYRHGLATFYARNVLNFAQPLVFSVASSLWGRTEAIAGYRSLFVLPLSMPARIAGDRTRMISDRVGTVIMWNVFTWCVGLLLAIAVMRDLKQRGMSSKTQHAWLFACMGFGWIAVITYLLTRPRLQFVTCTGCGKTRRTDQTHCLQCEADWAMCDLQAPGWRVVD